MLFLSCTQEFRIYFQVVAKSEFQGGKMEAGVSKRIRRLDTQLLVCGSKAGPLNGIVAMGKGCPTAFCKWDIESKGRWEDIVKKKCAGFLWQRGAKSGVMMGRNENVRRSELGCYEPDCVWKSSRLWAIFPCYPAFIMALPQIK